MARQTRECLICGTSFTPLPEIGNILFCSPLCEQADADHQVLLAYITQLTPIRIQRWHELIVDRQLRHLLRGVVWQQGQHEFMVCEDYTYATMDFRTYHLTPDPISPLSDMPLLWRGVFWDYEIIPLKMDIQEEQAISVVHTLVQTWLIDQFFELSAPQVYRLWSEKSAPSMPLMVKLAQHPAEDVRYMIAVSKYLTPELAEQLAQDADLEVRRGVAKNYQTPRPLLRELAKDVTLRQAVAANPHLGRYLRGRLRHDPDPLIRETLADNPAVSTSTLKRMLKDPDERVAARAKSQLLHLEWIEVAARG